MCGTVSPASAGESGGGGQTPVVGGFGLGDRLEGLIDAQSGDFSFTVPVAGLEVSWGSRGAGVDRFGLGGGWAIAGVSQLDVDGGVRVFPAAGDVYEADASAPSGLHGYTLGDLSFSQDAGVLPARGDGLAGEREYAYRLSELGGVVTYFDALGDPVATIDRHGLRRDWVWGDGHRLERVVSEVGVVTELDWAESSRLEVTTQAGGSAAAGAATRTVVSGVIEFDDDRVSAVVDAVGSRTAVTYDADGSVIRLDDASGAETAVTWQRLDDGRTVVDRVAVAEPGTGRELSARTWAPVTAGPTGWPIVGESPSSAASGGPSYRTVLSDGATQVESTYTASHLMTSRDVELVTPTGSQAMQSQTFVYPGADASGAADLAAPGHRPTAATTTYRDATGAERSVGEQYTFDALGRATHAADGTQYRYDAANRTIGETTRDGDIIDTTYWATGERRSLSATDELTGATQSTAFHWADGALVNDTHVNGDDPALTVSYLLTGAGRHARSTPDTSGAIATSYATHDRHGNVTELTDADGAVTERYSYSDYGVTEQLASGAPVDGERMLRVGDATYQPFRFAGEYTNPTPARTQHLAIREYDAGTMRFTRLDPELLHNRFGFADLNPIMKVDPSGRTPTFDFDTTVNWVFATVGFVAFVISTAGAGAGLAMIAPYLSTGAVAANAALIAATGLVEAATVAAAATQIADDLSPDFTLTGEQRDILNLTQLVGAGATAVLGMATAITLRVSTGIAAANVWGEVDELTPTIGKYLQARQSPINTWNLGDLKSRMTWMRNNKDGARTWNSYVIHTQELSGDYVTATSYAKPSDPGRTFRRGLGIKRGYTSSVRSIESKAVEVSDWLRYNGSVLTEAQSTSLDLLFPRLDDMTELVSLQDLLPAAQQVMFAAL
jgi:RHS repeat-associated protein